MPIAQLDIFHLRNIQRASITPSPKLNFIIGPNASGKSSLLEAIFIIGRAKSFRTSLLQQSISFAQNSATITARTQIDHYLQAQLGVKITKKNAIIHINGESKKRSDLAYQLPLQLISPQSYKLLDEGSQFRREFMDWGIFNMNPSFLNIWRKYKLVLQHRNTLLKQFEQDQISIWNNELIKHAMTISQYRNEYITDLRHFFEHTCRNFLGEQDFNLKYKQGWDQDSHLKEILEKDLERDLRFGYTHAGPHRADFVISHNAKNVKDYASRGQIKLLVLSLKLAQVEFFVKQKKSTVCILIDDLNAELDIYNIAKLVKYLTDLNCQVFMSSTSLENFGSLNDIKEFKVFHVEHGQIFAE